MHCVSYSLLRRLEGGITAKTHDTFCSRRWLRRVVIEGDDLFSEFSFWQMDCPHSDHFECYREAVCFSRWKSRSACGFRTAAVLDAVVSLTSLCCYNTDKTQQGNATPTVRTKPSKTTHRHARLTGTTCSQGLCLCTHGNLCSTEIRSVLDEMRPCAWQITTEDVCRCCRPFVCAWSAGVSQTVAFH